MINRTLLVSVLAASLVGVFGAAPAAWADECSARGEKTLVLNKGQANEETSCYLMDVRAGGTDGSGFPISYSALVAIARPEGVTCLVSIDEMKEGEESSIVPCKYINARPNELKGGIANNYSVKDLMYGLESDHLGSEAVVLTVSEKNGGPDSNLRFGTIGLITDYKKTEQLFIRSWQPTTMKWHR